MKKAHLTLSSLLSVLTMTLMLWSPARADYVVKDGSGTTQTIKAGTLGTCSGLPCILPWYLAVDATGAAFGVSGNPFFVTSATGGATTDAPCTLPATTTACTQTAIQKATANAVSGPIPTQAASVIIGGVGVPSWAGGTLGAMANYGTSPGAVLVPGVNSFSTNLPTVPVSVAPVTATNPAVVVDLRPDSPGIITLGPAAVANSVPHVNSSQYPTNNVTTTPAPITGNSTGTTGAVVGTLAAAASVTTYICGFTVDAVGGTATIGPITVAGLIGSSMVFQLFSSAAGATKMQTFSPCIPASAANTAITITTTANGTATAVDVNSWGYRL